MREKLVEFKPMDDNEITFFQDHGATEILKFTKNGDIFVKGRLAENDKEVVDALREFLTFQGFLKDDSKQ